MFFSEESVIINSRDEICMIGCGKGYFDEFDTKSIDYLIIYDFRNSTIGNFSTLSKMYDIEYIYIPDYIPEEAECENFLSLCDDEDAVVIRVDGSMSFAVGDGSVTVSAGMNRQYENVNDYSLMTKISLAENRMLLCGSAGGERMAEYIKNEDQQYLHLNLTECQKGLEAPLVQKLLPESIIFTGSEPYVDGYDVYDITKGPIIYKG